MKPIDFKTFFTPETSTQITKMIEDMADAFYFGILGVAGLIVFSYLALAVYRALNHPLPSSSYGCHCSPAFGYARPST